MILHDNEFRLLTCWGTQVFFDSKTGTLRHGKPDAVPHNLRARISSEQAVITYTTNDASGDSKTEHFKVAHDKADITLSRDNQFAFAEPDGRLTVTRPEPRECGYFLPLLVQSPRDVQPGSERRGDNQSRGHTDSNSPIKLFWWKASSQVNLGDALSPRVVAAISGREVVHAPPETADLLAVGSIMTACPPCGRTTPPYIWGSGLIEAGNVKTERYIYCSVRGPLTRAFVSRSMDLPLGDAGLLTSHVWKASSSKKYRWGIIPHFTQAWMPVFQGLLEHTPRSVMIDPADPDIDRTIQIISECEFIASTSLHGLIIADAYQIPNIWVKTPTAHIGGNFKFYDYFASVGRPENEATSMSTDIDLTIFEKNLTSTEYFRNIPSVQKSIIDSFPPALRAT